jgi:predicted alpha-1,6-mannanase (GH76 family)
MTRLCETQNATIAIQAKQLAELGELRKKAKKGKRVRLEGVAVYTTAEVLRIARGEEAKTATKKRRGPQKKVVLVESSSEEEDEVSKESEQEVYRTPVTRGDAQCFRM